MAKRPILKGTISFGLVAIPVTLYSGEVIERAHFHLLDKTNHARIRYERVNDITGKKVAFGNIVKAYEFEKNHYVTVDDKILENAEDENFKTIDIQAFLDANAIEFPFFKKPYFLAPEKSGEKGYFLLFEVLKKMKKIAIAKFVIKTKQYIGVISPYKNILLLNELRYQDEIISTEEIFSEKIGTKRKINPGEVKVAEQLVGSMSEKWDPRKYHDRSRELLQSLINKKIKKGSTYSSVPATKSKKKESKIIDFMELLKKSVKEKEKKKHTKTVRKK